MPTLHSQHCVVGVLYCIEQQEQWLQNENRKNSFQEWGNHSWNPLGHYKVNKARMIDYSWTAVDYEFKMKRLSLYSKEASVQLSRSVMSNSLWPHESQHARPPCPSPTPRVHSDSCPSSQWCYPAISSSIVPFSSCSQSLPASESFPMSQLFTSGDQRIGVSVLASVLPVNTQDWSRKR